MARQPPKNGGKMPLWVDALHEEALESEQWAAISTLVEARMEHILERRGLTAWVQFSEAEKKVLIDEIEDDIRRDPSYTQFFARLGGSLDKGLMGEEAGQRGAAEAAAPGRRIAGRRPCVQTEVGAALEVAGEAVNFIVRKWPERMPQLRVIGASSLPAALRRGVWELVLVSPAAQREYAELAEHNRLDVVSRQDIEISKVVRLLLDTEMEGGDQSAFTMPIKSVISYLDTRRPAPADTPLSYITMVLVATLSYGGGQDLDTGMLVQRLHALLDEVKYASYFSLSDFSVLPDGEWGTFTKQVSAALLEVDPDLHTFLEDCARVTYVGQEENVQELQDLDERYEAWRPLKDTRSDHRVKVTTARADEHRPWNLDILVNPPVSEDMELTTPGRARNLEGGEVVKAKDLWGALTLPLMQRLFAGFLDTIQNTAIVWDIMLLMGAARLPSLCAAFFMAQKHALYDLLPQPGEACSLYLLERAMNSTCGAARAMSVQDLMQRYFILPTRIDPGIRDIRPALLQSLLPTEHGEPAQLTRHGTQQTEVGGGVGAKATTPGDEDGQKRRRRRVDSGTQTDAGVALESGEGEVDVDMLLSPRVYAERIEVQAAEAVEAEVFPRSQALKDFAQTLADAPEEYQGLVYRAEIWYGTRVFSITIPAFDKSRHTLCSAADLTLNHEENEALLSAVIQQERRIPSTVARVALGSQIRPARASNVDVPLIAAIKSKHPDLMDDYPKPLLRIDLVDPVKSAQASVYFPALMRGTTIAFETAEKRLPECGFATTHEQSIEVARLLEAYSQVAARAPLQRVDPRADSSTPIAPEKQVDELVGFDIRIDSTFHTMLATARSMDASVVFNAFDEHDMNRVAMALIMRDLATVMRVEKKYLHPVGLHKLGKDKVMAEFNLGLPYLPSGNRTAMQALDHLMVMMDNPFSPLKKLPTLVSAVRVIVRGRAHEMHVRKFREKLEPGGGAGGGEDAQEAIEGRQGSKGDNADEEEAHPGATKGLDGADSKGSLTGADVKGVSHQSSFEIKKQQASERYAAGMAMATTKVGSGNALLTSVAESASEAPAGAQLGSAMTMMKAMSKLKGKIGPVKYFYSVNKERIGPKSLEQMKELFAAGTVSLSTPIWHKALGSKWVKVGEDTALLDLFTSLANEPES